MKSIIAKIKIKIIIAKNDYVKIILRKQSSRKIENFEKKSSENFKIYDMRSRTSRQQCDLGIRGMPGPDYMDKAPESW